MNTDRYRGKQSRKQCKHRSPSTVVSEDYTAYGKRLIHRIYRCDVECARSKTDTSYYVVADDVRHTLTRCPDAKLAS